MRAQIEGPSSRALAEPTKRRPRGIRTRIERRLCPLASLRISPHRGTSLNIFTSSARKTLDSPSKVLTHSPSRGRASIAMKRSRPDVLSLPTPPSFPIPSLIQGSPLPWSTTAAPPLSDESPTAPRSTGTTDLLSPGRALARNKDGARTCSGFEFLDFGDVGLQGEESRAKARTL